MNNQQADHPAEAIPTELITAAPPLWRLQIVRVIEILGVVAMFLGGAEFLNLLNALPGSVAPEWAFLVGGVVNKTAKPVIEFFGDWFDDGEFNKSFRIERAGVIAILFCAACLLPSCGHALSGATGQPIHVTPVKRLDGGTPINVATVDLIRAESQPDNVYGLYNAGAVADFAGRVVDSGK